MVGDALSSGDSVYESDEDIELVGDALPFGLKLTESLLTETPNHEGLLLTACRGFVLYSYAYVDYPAELTLDEDFDRGRAMRDRARRLYERALRYCLRGLDRHYEGFAAELVATPERAVSRFEPRRADRDLPLIYWTAAALGLGISVSPGSAAMLARLPEVEALLERALGLDESWNNGALHEFKVTFAGAVPGETDYEEIQSHYDRALLLTGGQSAGLHVAYAEAVSVPTQNGPEFREMMEKALAVDPRRRSGEPPGEPNRPASRDLAPGARRGSDTRAGAITRETRQNRDEDWWNHPVRDGAVDCDRAGHDVGARAARRPHPDGYHRAAGVPVGRDAPLHGSAVVDHLRGNGPRAGLRRRIAG